MKPIIKKIVRRTGMILLMVLGVFVVLMLVPRTLSWIFPSKTPVGYYYTIPTFLAVGVGLDKLVERKPAVPEGIREIKNIEYKNIGGKSLQIDMYVPKNITKPVPLLVFIHGGGWKGGQRSDYMVYLIPFAQQGYITATVSYRLSDKANYPACAEDIRDAVRWFFQNGETYGYDPDRIALIGGSAGGHLSMLTGYGWSGKDSVSQSKNPSPHKIKAVVDFYGPYDLTTPYARSHSLVTNFLETTYDKNPEVFREASPITYLDRDDPPTMIIQGTSDDLVPVSQSDSLKANLDRLGIPNNYLRLPGWPHTMDIAKRVNDYCRENMEDFLKKHL